MSEENLYSELGRVVNYFKGLYYMQNAANVKPYKDDSILKVDNSFILFSVLQLISVL